MGFANSRRYYILRYVNLGIKKFTQTPFPILLLIILLYGGTLIWRDPKETVIWQAVYEISNLADTFQVKLHLHRSMGKLKNAPYKMDNFSKLKQFKSKSEILADPLAAAKLPAGIDQSKKGSIHYITFYIV